MRHLRLFSILISFLIVGIGVAFADSPVVPYPAGGGSAGTLPVLFSDGGTAISDYSSASLYGVKFGPTLYIKGAALFGSSATADFATSYLGSATYPWALAFLKHALVSSTVDNGAALQVDGGVTVIGGVGLSMLATPPAPTVNCSTGGGSLAAGSYCYKTTALDFNGQETLASPETCGTVASGTTGSCSVGKTASFSNGSTSWGIYGRTTGAEQKIATQGASTVYVDTGSTTPAGALPATNKTGGIMFGDGTTQATAAGAPMLPVLYADGGTAISEGAAGNIVLKGSTYAQGSILSVSGHALVGTSNDDGTNALQVNGAFAIYNGTTKYLTIDSTGHLLCPGSLGGCAVGGSGSSYIGHVYSLNFDGPTGGFVSFNGHPSSDSLANISIALNASSQAGTTLTSANIVDFRNNGTTKSYIDFSGGFQCSGAGTCNIGGTNAVAGVTANTVLLTSMTLPSCDNTKEGRIYRDATGGFAGTGETKICVCVYNSAATPSAAWRNLFSGSRGDATTCPQ